MQKSDDDRFNVLEDEDDEEKGLFRAKETAEKITIRGMIL